MRFTAHIVRRCGFAVWGLRGGSFSMYVRVETGFMRADWNGVQIWARVAIARRKDDAGGG